MQKYIALLKVIEVGSFTKAAELLGYTQPSLSQMIASLEKELSVQLIHRSRYGIRLTPEGEHLMPYIESAVRQYESMRQAVKEVSGLESGSVRIGTFSSITCHWLPAVIEDFWSAHPKIRLHLLQGDYTSIAEWVRIGLIDFGFVNPDAIQGMATRELFSDEFHAILPKDHPLAVKETVSLTDMANEPFLLLEEGQYSEPLEAFRAAGLTPDIRLSGHDDYSILSMVERGLGVSILPELVLRKTAYQIVSRQLDPPVVRKIGIVMKEQGSLPLASRSFLRCLFEQAP